MVAQEFNFPRLDTDPVLRDDGHPSLRQHVVSADNSDRGDFGLARVRNRRLWTEDEPVIALLQSIVHQLQTLTLTIAHALDTDIANVEEEPPPWP